MRVLKGRAVSAFVETVKRADSIFRLVNLVYTHLQPSNSCSSVVESFWDPATASVRKPRTALLIGSISFMMNDYNFSKLC